MSISCYVYYRVPAGQRTQARQAVAAMFEDLRKRMDVSCRLARRRDDPSTWMEIYERFRDIAEFERELEAGTERHGLKAFVDPGSARKTEIFVADVLLPDRVLTGSGDTQCA